MSILDLLVYVASLQKVGGNPHNACENTCGVFGEEWEVIKLIAYLICLYMLLCWVWSILNSASSPYVCL